MQFCAAQPVFAVTRLLLTVGKFALAAAVAFLIAAPAAHGQTLLACPDSEDALLTYPPDFIREADTWIASATVDGSPSRVINVSIAVEQTPTPLAIDEDGNAKIVMPAVPPTHHDVVVTFQWDQDLGTQAACHGSDVYTVPYARIDDKVGRATTTRLDGTYRAKYTRDEGTATWRLNPMCDLLACSTKMRSNGGLKGTLKLRNDGTYAMTDDLSGFGECIVHNNITGSTRTFRPAYVRHRLIVLKRSNATEEIADRLTGTVTDTYRPTAAARGAGCTSDVRHSKITLTRRS